jgi:hypothetical protein
MSRQETENTGVWGWEIERLTVDLGTRRRLTSNRPLIRPSGTFSPRGEGEGSSTSPLGERSAEGRVRGAAWAPDDW